MLIKILFWIGFSLFILHEMDAVRTSEWKMMIFFNRIDDDKAYIIFTSLHGILFIVFFFLIDNYFNAVFLFLSFFLIFHWFLHLFFVKHTENRMNNLFSRTIITLMFLNSCISLFCYFVVF